jgi:hypothetical protein
MSGFCPKQTPPAQSGGYVDSPNRTGQAGLLRSVVRGRPEVSAIWSKRCDQPEADVGRLLASATQPDQFWRIQQPDPARRTSGPNLVSIQSFRASSAISVISSAQNSFRSSNARAYCLLKSSSFGSRSRYRYVMLHMPGSSRTRTDGPALRNQFKQLGPNVSDLLDGECRARPALGILDRGSLLRHDPIMGVPAFKSNMLPLLINISYYPLKDIPAMPTCG